MNYKKLIATQHNPTIAPLAGKDGVTIRLTAKSKTTEQEAERMIEETKKKYFRRSGCNIIMEIMKKLLKRKYLNCYKQKGVND